MRVFRALLAVVIAGVVLAGCGSNDRDQVRAKLDQFVKAIQHKDGKTICGQVLSLTLLDHLAAGGLTCQHAMQLFFTSVNEPGLAVGRIDMHGNSASAITITTARKQEAALEAIELVRTGDGWRVTSLGSPQIPVPTRK